MTLEEMQQIIKRGKIKEGKTILFRPVNVHGFAELDHELVEKALDFLMGKLLLVQMGLDEFSPAEVLAFKLLCLHCENA